MHGLNLIKNQTSFEYPFFANNKNKTNLNYLKTLFVSNSIWQKTQLMMMLSIEGIFEPSSRFKKSFFLTRCRWIDLAWEKIKMKQMSNYFQLLSPFFSVVVAVVAAAVFVVGISIFCDRDVPIILIRQFAKG